MIQKSVAWIEYWMKVIFMTKRAQLNQIANHKEVDVSTTDVIIIITITIIVIDGRKTDKISQVRYTVTQIYKYCLSNEFKYIIKGSQLIYVSARLTNYPFAKCINSKVHFEGRKSKCHPAFHTTSKMLLAWNFFRLKVNISSSFDIDAYNEVIHVRQI